MLHEVTTPHGICYMKGKTHRSNHKFLVSLGESFSPEVSHLETQIRKSKLDYTLAFAPSIVVLLCLGTKSGH